MAKDKKKKHKKDDVSEDILDVAALSIKKFRKVTKEIGKLSTGQKLVGGIALVAAGLAYLAAQETDAASAAEAEDDASGPAHLLPSHSAQEADAAPARHKSRKASKPKFAAEAESED
ncbi:hypothetical protein [Hymenobacter properus]|uniref:Uncharacterized protein n=1 Tax=Hymenobacter properus TaxID=2791026 RepID=A0A931FI91_9BACT|nr:hypothetical protein [Hymenobacter properus]MBF9141807.1 hypothetical protein [Hymenobacter properus]MBR7720615.1 hypothetical protein [Microvirga sp. SRT04]